MKSSNFFSNYKLGDVRGVSTMNDQWVYQRGDPFQGPVYKKKKFQQMIHDKTRFHITYILVESQRYLGILDTDHGMIKLVIPISILAIRI